MEGRPVRSPTRDHFRPRLILPLLAASGILFLLSYPYSPALYSSSFFFSVSVSSLPLATLEWFYSFSGRVQTRRLVLLFSMGIAATVGSAFHTTLLNVAGPCAPGVSGGGFPLSWYLTFTFYSGGGPVPPCPFLLD